MPLSIIYCRALEGVKSPLVTIEVHISNGLPGMSIVGLPETAVKESKDRVRSALLNSQFKFPDRRVTVNLAPADIPKEGSRFDLAIAIGILAASEQISTETLSDYEFIGELALSGEIRSVNGILPSAIQCTKDKRSIITAIDNAKEASLTERTVVYGAKHILDICQHLSGQKKLSAFEADTSHKEINNLLDISDIIGQHQAKRAIEIIAAGKHNLIMFGPPGTGKSMLANRLPGILPELTEEEALEVAAISSLQKKFQLTDWKKRPFRVPHHTASAVALVGGGSNPKPGEISLAHRGVLFLDELPEFDRKVLEVLREPLESGQITISRASKQIDYPANFQLIAAMNPCPCGYLGDLNDRCKCTSEQISRYRGKLSGPLIDRIDMHIEIPPVPHKLILKSQENSTHGDTSAIIKERVIQAQQIQLQRNGCLNAQMNNQQIKQFCEIDDQTQNLLESAIHKFGLSARAFHKILKVSRTIADIEASKNIAIKHASEAISYRKLDRKISI